MQLIIYVSEPLFGVELEAQCQSSRERNVPDILFVCAEEIEQRLKDDNSELVHLNSRTLQSLLSWAKTVSYFMCSFFKLYFPMAKC